MTPAVRAAWLEKLPAIVGELRERWRLSQLEPILCVEESSASWIAGVVLTDDTRAMLKIGMPHMEATHEVDGLRFWNGDPTVRLLDADVQFNAMLLEPCEPGVPLRSQSEAEQDRIIASLLRRMWRRPASPHPFRPLATMLRHWAEETRVAVSAWTDSGLIEEGLRLFDELSRPSSHDVLLATDLHAGNVLSAQREPWLVIDPKPFVGDRAYDATQHLLNGLDRFRADARATIRRVSDLLEVDPERVRLWTFARLAAEPREVWDDGRLTLAKKLT